MQLEEAFEVIMKSRPEDIHHLLKPVTERHTRRVLKNPESGLVMFRATESVEALTFNVGEVLVTQCEVQISDSVGYAMILGDNQEHALDCALWMAILESQLEEKRDFLAHTLKIKEKQQAALLFERELINSTRVHFETMGGQDPSVVEKMLQSEEEDV